MPPSTNDAPTRARVVRVVVLGDLLLDVVLAPHRPLVPGTDVAGRVSLRQGGSAATTARWLARLGARSTLITSVGRDPAGRALLGEVREDSVTVRAIRPPGQRTGRIGVILGAGGERSFVADRGAADALAAADLRAAWFSRADLLHLPFYSLIGPALGGAGRRAAELTRVADGLLSVDLASSVPLLADGRRAALARLREVRPDILFATLAEVQTLLGAGPLERLLSLAPVAVVKRGSKGATVLARGPINAPGSPEPTGLADASGVSGTPAVSGVSGTPAVSGAPGVPGGADDARSPILGARLRFEVATRPIDAVDTTGAGDAFDAGFLVTWLRARAAGVSLSMALQRSALAGHQAAARQLTAPRTELALG